MTSRLLAILMLTAFGAVLCTAADKHPTATGEHAVVSQMAVQPVWRAAGQPQGQDNWLGGDGNWSDDSKWSLGVPPVSGDDVTIFTPGGENVYFDIGSATISSLTLGGPANGNNSALYTNGGPQSLTISNGFTVGQSGVFALFAGGTLNLNGTTTDDGYIYNFSSTINNTGNFTVDQGILLAYGTFNNSGKFTVLPNLFPSQNAGIFVNTGNIELAGGLENFGNLTNKAGASLDISTSGVLYVDGVLYNSGLMTNAGIIENNQSITIDRMGLLSNSGTIDNSLLGQLTTFGSFNNLAGGVINNDGQIAVMSFLTQSSFDNSGTITNYFDGSIHVVSGVFSNQAAGIIYNYGLFQNTGSFQNEGVVNDVGAFRNIGAGTYTQTAGTTLVQGFLESATTIQIKGGTLAGNGVINGDVELSGVLSPGDADGVATAALFLNGDYTQLAAGAYLAELEGIGVGFYDQFLTSGHANLDGTLNVVALPGFSAQVGDAFVLMTFLEETGVFSTVDLPSLPPGMQWQLLYDAQDLTLKVISSAESTATPEPGTMLLAAAGALTMLGRFRSHGQR